MNLSDVENIATDRVKQELTEYSSRGNIEINPATMNEIEKILRATLEAKKSEIEGETAIGANQDQVRRASVELAESALRQARKENRTVMILGDIVIGLVDMNVRGCIWPFCKSG
jgi:RNA-splicing ligase RtcB